MRVLVVAEGKHEEGEHGHTGALEHLLRRLGAEQASLEFRRMADNRIHAVHGKGPKLTRRALAWLRHAEQRGDDVLILLIDEDAHPDRISEISAAQEDTHIWPLPRAMGVAIRTFDAWMLADEKALTSVLGCQIAKQPDPERTNDPKKRCADLLANSPNDMPQSEMYAKICECVDLNVLRSRCARGFAPFAERTEGVFKPSK